MVRGLLEQAFIAEDKPIIEAAYKNLDGADFWDFDCKIGDSEQSAEEIHVSQINKEIWKNHKVIWMEDFVKKFRGVWYKRGKTLPKIDSNGNLSVPRNLQESKVKESKKYTLVDYKPMKDAFFSDDIAVGNIKKKYSLSLQRLKNEATLMIKNFSKKGEWIEDFEDALDTWLLIGKGILEDAQQRDAEMDLALDSIIED